MKWGGEKVMKQKTETETDPVTGQIFFLIVGAFLIPVRTSSRYPWIEDEIFWFS